MTVHRVLPLLPVPGGRERPASLPTIPHQRPPARPLLQSLPQQQLGRRNNLYRRIPQLRLARQGYPVTRSGRKVFYSIEGHLCGLPEPNLDLFSVNV